MLRTWIEERSELEFQAICFGLIVLGLFCLQFAYKAMALHDIEFVDGGAAGDPVSTTGPRDPVPEPATPEEAPEPAESEGE